MKVAINGFGRIGKLVLRAFLEKNLKGVDVVAINELGSVESSLHLMQFDSIHGKLPVEIKKTSKGLKYKNKEIKFFSERDPKNLPWKQLKVDVVLLTPPNILGYTAAKRKDNPGIKVNLVFHLGDTVGANDQSIAKARQDVKDLYDEYQAAYGWFSTLYFLPQIKQGKNKEILRTLIKAR